MALTSLNDNEFEKALLILAKSDGLSRPIKFGIFQEMKALNCNTYAIYYIKCQDMPNAQLNLEKALSLMKT